MSGAKFKHAWDFNFVSQDLNEKLLQDFKGERSSFLQVGPKKYFLPAKFAQDGVKYYNFKPRASDIWVVTFPRSGTTWTQEMVWLLANDLDFSTAAEISLLERFPFLEFSSCVNDVVLDEFLNEAESDEIKKKLINTCRSLTEELEMATNPRFIKTHLPLSLLPPDLLTSGAKVLYVARNPKDVAVSYFNFHQFIKTLDFVGDFDCFWNYFQKNLVLWTPYWSHIIEGWEARFNPNFLFLFYEDLQKDLYGGIKKISSFLQKQYKEEDLRKLTKHLDFDNFKKNQSVNMEAFRELGMLANNDQRCVRSGKSGNWRDFFNNELNSQANKWIEDNLKNTDLKFPFGMEPSK